jgi:3-phosphoshikimate 1-carboxyvinyltransferase
MTGTSGPTPTPGPAPTSGPPPSSGSAPAPGGLVTVRVPGDKSISHRALLLAALADGESRLEGVLPGADCQSTAEALRALGVEVPELPADGAPFRIRGVGATGLRAPGAELDCGNSGTTARLLLGVLSGAGVPAILTGDASLLSRPMRRVTAPLEAMGVRFREEGHQDRLPIRVLGEGEFRGGRWVLPVASAQVKSALLLAALLSGRPMAVEEPGRSRDHTERMLRTMGVPVRSVRVESAEGPGREERWSAALEAGPHRLRPLELRVPGDPSSAAFLVALAALGGAGAGLRIEGVGLNPTRIGFLHVFRRMGVAVEVIPDAEAEEPTGTLVVRPSELRGTEVGGAEVPSLIDELPLVAAMAARARGVTRIRDAAELRVKESDRIAAMASNLRALGVTVREYPDGLDVEGSDARLTGSVATWHDHRIAMSFGILGALPGARVEVETPEMVEVSFPGFWELLGTVSAASASGSGRPGPSRDVPVRRPEPSRPPVVTLDGPAGSGKSTTAREVARRLGFLHLDSGALYRAVTLALLEAERSGEGRPEPEWDGVTVAELDAFDIALERHEGGFRVRVGNRHPEAELRSAEVTERVSRVARIPAVRDWLLATQRHTARDGGVVADGRDMGTVVFPEAEVKIFLVADLEERARRRLAETREAGADAEPEVLEAEARRLSDRDREDARRAVAPLRPAPDAVELDTTDLTFDEQVDRVVERVRAVEAGSGGT